MNFDIDIATTNYQGEERKVGFEFESAQLTLQGMADIVRETFGGKLKVINEFSFEVVETPYGKFSIESDSSFLKAKKYEDAVGRMTPVASKTIAETIAGPSRFLVPNEIVTPPIPISQIYRMDELRSNLLRCIQNKTRSLSVAPCGLHINPELADTSVGYILGILQAFTAVQEVLIKSRQITLLRKLWPYIAPYPKEYRDLIVNPYYRPDFKQLVDDYIRFNPTRNRALDVLPVFLWLDKDCLKPYHLKDEPLIKGRPAFHYRLPNCDLSNPNWTVAEEWNSWAAIDKIASRSNHLSRIMQKDHGALAEAHEMLP